MKRSTQALIGGLAATVAATLAFLPASAADVDHGRLVPAQVRTDLPRVLDGEVTDFVEFGERVVVVGNFTRVDPGDGSPELDVDGLFAFDPETGEIDRDLLLEFNGEVRAVVADDDALHIGGEFTSVDGQPRSRLARIEADGSLDPDFVVEADARVTALALDDGELIVGGNFNRIDGVTRASLARVDAATGELDESFDLPLAEGVGPAGLRTVRKIEVTPDGQRAVVLHTATTIDDQTRVGAAIVDLDAAEVTEWRTRFWEDELAEIESIRTTDMDLSPDGSFFVVTSTGGDAPPTNDVAVRLPTSGGDGVEVDWISRHFDSIYAVAVTDVAVYTGGHFRYQEAPNSTEPWPGDNDRDYGFSVGNGGAGVLGDEVVPRRQVGALDPDTGWGLPWGPGADGFRGVLALEATEQGLWLGHDGSNIAGERIGRFGLFDLSVEGEFGGPETGILAPANMSTFSSDQPVVVRGVASADEGISHVRLEAFNAEQGVWLRADGTVGEWEPLRVEVRDPGAVSSDWSTELALPAGGWQVLARTVDLAGERDPSRSVIQLEVLEAGADVEAATSTIDSPAESETVTSPLVVRGTATDNVGIGRVRIGFRERNERLWLQPDGTLGTSFVRYEVELDDNGRLVNWSYPVDLPPGAWQADVVAEDVSGNRQLSPSRVRFRVVEGGGEPADGQPTVSVLSPLDGDQVEAGVVRLSGRAQDDSEVRRVFVALRERDSGQWLRPDGSLGAYHRFAAVLGEQGADEVSWRLAVELEVGDWQAQVVAVDDADEVSDIAQVVFEVAGVAPTTAAPTTAVPTTAVPTTAVPTTAAPTTAVPTTAAPTTAVPTTAAPTTAAPTTVAPGGEVAVSVDAPAASDPGPVQITGSARADAGVRLVLVGVRDRVSDLWLQPDGSLGDFRRWAADLDTQFATETGWVLPLDLPAGSWSIEVVAVDADDRRSDGQRTRLRLGAASDEAPTVSIGSPATGSVVGTTVTVEGMARDDQGVAQVLVGVRDRATDQWLQADGTMGAWVHLPLSMANPGGTESSWSGQFTLPTGGLYAFEVVAVDSIGQVSTTETVRIEASGKAGS